MDCGVIPVVIVSHISQDKLLRVKNTGDFHEVRQVGCSWMSFVSFRPRVCRSYAKSRSTQLTFSITAHADRL